MIDSPFSRGKLLVISLSAAVGTGTGILAAPLTPWIGRRGGAVLTIIFGVLIILGVESDFTTENSPAIRSIVTSFFTGYLTSLIIFKIFEPDVLLGGMIAFTISFFLAPRIP